MTSNYKVGIYLRLSKEDGNNLESNSIGSQREILTNYIKENNLELIREYVDDGFSGTTFNRIGFNQMIRDIIENKINMVVVKDLSRLGRDHIEFGTYVERFFPEHQVRLVALGDGYDSAIYEKNNTTMILFKSMYNEMYVKDISDKIKMSISNKRKMGYFLGPTAPYGYNKDPLDHHKLVIDEYSSNIVKRIFNLFIKGNSITNICRILTKDNIPIPSIYKNLNRGLKSTCYGEWTTRTITDILTNPTYIGNLTQGRLRKVNYKSKKIIHTKKKDWIITYNTCPKIIEESIFKEAENIYNSNKNRTKNNTSILLKGLVRCKECNHTIGFRIQKSKTSSGIKMRIYGNCNYYLKHRNSNACSPHSVKYEELENIIINEVNKELSKVSKDKIKKIIDNLNNNTNSKNNIEKEINYLKKEITNNNLKLDNMYIDKLNNLINKDMYERIKDRIINENKVLENNITLLKDKFNNSISKVNNYDIEKLLKINKNLLSSLVDYILIDKENNIEIYYKFFC